MTLKASNLVAEGNALGPIAMSVRTLKGFHNRGRILFCPFWALLGMRPYPRWRPAHGTYPGLLNQRLSTCL